MSHAFKQKGGAFYKGRQNTHMENNVQMEHNVQMETNIQDRGGRGSKELARTGQLGKWQQQCMSVGHILQGRSATGSDLAGLEQLPTSV